jgi:hypothetical protein
MRQHSGCRSAVCGGEITSAASLRIRTPDSDGVSRSIGSADPIRSVQMTRAHRDRIFYPADRYDVRGSTPLRKPEPLRRLLRAKLSSRSRPRVDAVSMVAQQRRHAEAAQRRLHSGRRTGLMRPSRCSKDVCSTACFGACPGNVGMTTHTYGAARRSGFRRRDQFFARADRRFVWRSSRRACGEPIIRPGFPADWLREHPASGFCFAFERDGATERFTVEPNFPAPWRRDCAPALRDRGAA